jgi:hypothetical protein
MPSIQAATDESDPFYANFASNRAELSLSEEKLRRYQPEAFGFSGLLWSIRKRVRFKWLLAQCLKYGDARAAIVASVSPLIVAAYSDEFDAVLALRYPDAFTEHFSLTIGQHLISVTAYGPTPARDIVRGSNAETEWGNFVPTIAEFFSDDVGRIEHLHSRISDREWNRCRELCAVWMTTRTPRARDGLPLHADASTV